MPGIALSPSRNILRRRSNVARISATDSAAFSGCSKTASAPNCAKLVQFDDIWLCRLETAFAIGSGAAIVPRRQPVIA